MCVCACALGVPGWMGEWVNEGVWVGRWIGGILFLGQGRPIRVHQAQNKEVAMLSAILPIC